MKVRHMHMYTSFCGNTILHFPKPPREVRESFEKGGEGVKKGVTQYTTSGAITTSWTNALICDDYVWVRITHPYSDEEMMLSGTAERLAYAVALEAECSLPDAMTAITGAGHI